MRGPVSIAAGLAALAVASFAVQARAEGREERVAERIRSDLPLYTFEWEDLWPRSYRSDEEFGCTSRVGFGDWRFVPADSERRGISWHRYSNYGVFHCAAVMRVADEQSELAKAEWEYGFFVLIGEARVLSKKWELWVLQKGMIPGSEYVLLARESGLTGLVDRFRVLQRRCPPGAIREVGGLDVWSTRYCSIESRAELLALARRMVRRPPLGTISKVAELPESADEE